MDYESLKARLLENAQAHADGGTAENAEATMRWLMALREFLAIEREGPDAV